MSFHTLRYTAATRLLAANVDIKTVSAILGHSTSRMLFERYAHESETRKQAALRRIQGRLGTLCAHRDGRRAKSVARDRRNL